MKVKLINDGQGERTYAVVFDKGDEVIAGLCDFALSKGLGASQLTAIGGFSDATLGYFDRERKDYRKIPVQEQTEVLSMVGDITVDEGKPKVHTHVVLGRADGTTRGGHILEAHVWPTLEVIVVESPRHLRRTHDPETGLALISL
jgi:predicted DNA-binding protein with PD1-like motif